VVAGAVIEIDGLRKAFTRRRGVRATRRLAVDGLDLAVPAGGVFGFLGPNGSGKTTTIRCLLGLVAPTAGTCRAFGADVRTHLPAVLPRVGALVEAPALLPTMTARTNLALLARTAGVPPRRVDDVLGRVGLSGREGDLVRTYSLGMRQRLGLAAALLRDPELLVLDEPSNGLDPAGMREVRELLLALGREGRTVFVSSHLLTEVEQVCDRVAILARGRCVAAGPVADVVGHHRRGVAVRVADVAAAQRVVEAAGVAAELDDDGLLLVDVPSADGALVAELLGRHDIWPSELRPVAARLEDVFLALTGEVAA
jgi:ABC-2 type transport system ATP-binding protein